MMTLLMMMMVLLLLMMMMMMVVVVMMMMMTPSLAKPSEPPPAFETSVVCLGQGRIVRGLGFVAWCWVSALVGGVTQRQG